MALSSLQHRILSRKDVDVLIQGAAILGAGGGGHLDEAEHYINLAFSQPKPPTVIDIANVDDDAFIISPFLMGCSTDDYPLPSDPPLAHAVQTLNSSLAKSGCSLNAIVPAEMGATNIAVTLFVSAVHGIPVIDGDPTGRAVPEVNLSLFAVHRTPTGIVCAATPQGEQIVFHNISNAARKEDLLRAVCAVSNNDLSVVHHAIRMKEARRAIMEGTLSRAIAIGRDYVSEKGGKNDVAEIVARFYGGRLLLRGTVRGREYKILHGLTVGYAEINMDGDSGDIARVEFKNENMAVRVGHNICATVPEIITALHEASGEIVLNPGWQVGTRVAIIVLPAPPGYLTEDGLKCFGPSYIGIDAPFRSAISDTDKQ